MSTCWHYLHRNALLIPDTHGEEKYHVTMINQSHLLSLSFSVRFS
jgi:hypothetical protein